MITPIHEFQLRFYYFWRFGWLLWQEIGHFVKLLIFGKQVLGISPVLLTALTPPKIN